MKHSVKTLPFLLHLVAVLLLAFRLGFICGETLRDALYGPAQPAVADQAQIDAAKRKWCRYSGLFILLKQVHTLSPACWRQLQAHALRLLGQIVLPSPALT